MPKSKSVELNHQLFHQHMSVLDRCSIILLDPIFSSRKQVHHCESLGGVEKSQVDVGQMS